MTAPPASATTTVMAGLILLTSDPSPMPRVLPSPAAPITMPSSTPVLRPLIGFSRNRNAMNIVRNPDNQRGPQLARSACATCAGIPKRRRLVVLPVLPGSSAIESSPWLASTFAGSRIARIVPPTNTRNA